MPKQSAWGLRVVFLLKNTPEMIWLVDAQDVYLFQGVQEEAFRR